MTIAAATTTIAAAMTTVALPTLVACTYSSLSFLSVLEYVHLSRATFFYQDGNPGACGQVHSDSDFICAMGEYPLMASIRASELRPLQDQIRYGDSGNASPLCGKQVTITNTDNGKSVTVTVADDCPTCDNDNSIDLSVAAFDAIASESTGEVPISWYFV